MIKCFFEDQNPTTHPPALLRHAVTDMLLLNQDQTQIFLVKRGPHMVAEPNKWALPGGYVDRDETAQQAAIREALEETGYAVTDVEFLFFVDNPHREDRQNISFIYRGTAAEQIQTPDQESSDQRWWPLNDLPEQMGFDHAEIIRRAFPL